VTRELPPLVVVLLEVPMSSREVDAASIAHLFEPLAGGLAFDRDGLVVDLLPCILFRRRIVIARGDGAGLLAGFECEELATVFFGDLDGLVAGVARLQEVAVPSMEGPS
jgi:hypothetical protein